MEIRIGANVVIKVAVIFNTVWFLFWYCKVRIDKHLSDNFPIQKIGDALSTLLFKFL
jgi:hypothetical protein